MSEAVSLILLRHGESSLTADGKFAGWTDANLSDRGYQEAVEAGRLILGTKTRINAIYTSVLQRSISTGGVIENLLRIEGLCMDSELEKHHCWQLNERCYGQLEGKNKKECSALYSPEQVRLWRRSFSVRPPPLEHSDPRWPGNNSLYKDLPIECIPDGESPQDVETRLKPLFEKVIIQKLKEKKSTLIISHGTTLRCLMKMLEGWSVEEIETTEIPSGVPIIYTLDSSTMRVLNKKYLVDGEELARKTQQVRDQSELDSPAAMLATTSTVAP